MNKLGEHNTDDWEQIKGWVVGGNKQTKHPLVQEADHLKQKSAQYMDDGGIAQATSFGDNIDQAINPQPQVPNVQNVSNDQNYDNQASQILGGVTPEKISQLMQSLNSYNAKGQIGAGIAGIGDAISKGVGRVDQNMMGQAEDTIKNRTDQALKIPAMMAGIGKERYGLSHELQTQDSNSPYSKVWQNAHKSELLNLGVPEESIPKIPAEIGDKMLNGQIELKKGLAEIENTAEFRRESLKNERLGLEQAKEAKKSEAEHQRAEEEVSAKEQAEKQDQEAAKHWIAHPINAMEANKRLSEGSSGNNHGIPDLRNTFNGQKVINVKRIK